MMRSSIPRRSSVTTPTRMPSCLRSSWTMVAICARSAFPELVSIVNSTALRWSSTNVPSGNHEKPAARRHGLAERELPKPSPPGRRFGGPVRRWIVLVEEQELVVQSGAEILELVFAARLILQEELEVGRAQLRRYVRLAGLEPHRLSVFA